MAKLGTFLPVMFGCPSRRCRTGDTADEEPRHEGGSNEGRASAQTAEGDAQAWCATELGAPSVSKAGSKVFPQIDDDDDSSEAAHEQFYDLFPSGTETPEELSKISFGVQKDIGHRLLKEGLPLIAVCLLLSAVSFCSMMFYFLFVLRVPSESELPAGYSSWGDCDQNATELSVTAFAHELSFKEARNRVSIPKFFEVATLCTLVARLAAPKNCWQSLFVGAASFFIASASSAVFAFADTLGIRCMPFFADPITLFSIGVALFLSVSSTTIRARSSSNRTVARCPRVLFFFAVMLLFSFNAFVCNLLRILYGRRVHPILVVSVAIFLTRGFGIMVRWVFTQVNLPLLASFGIVFTYDTSTALALRRYVLAFQDLRATIMAAWCSVVLELAVHCASSMFAVHRYNKLRREQSNAAASVYIHTYFVAIVSELISEHVALHGCLAYSLFLDPRILNINVQFDKALAVAGWGWSFFAEITADLVTFGVMIAVLPTTFNAVLKKAAGSWTFVLVLLICCLHPHLTGLHSYVDPADYFCERQS